MTSASRPAVPYADVFRKLQAAYVGRLQSSVEAIDNVLAQRQRGPLSRNDLTRAEFLTHGLAGSGTSFGFPDVTEHGRKAELFITSIVRSLPDGSVASDSDLETLNALLLELRAACQVGADTNLGPLPAPQEARQNTAPQKSFVLLIDDDEELAKLLAGVLEDKGIAVKTAAGGKQALEMIRDARPDLIILDIMMPDISGQEVLLNLKQNPEFVSIPIIMLTGKTENRDVADAFHSGALDYVMKPFDVQALAAKIEQTLHPRQRSILLIDDDLELKALFKSCYENLGFRILMVNHYREALEEVGKLQPDLIVMDPSVQEVSDFSILRKLRSEAPTRDIPVIVLSHGGTEQDALQNGAQNYFAKPFFADELIGCSLRLLKKA